MSHKGKNQEQACNYTAVVYSKKDVKQFLIDCPPVKYIYPLTPNSRAGIKGISNYKIRIPEQIFTDFSHRRVIASVRSIEKIILPIIEREKKLSLASKETYISLLHVSLTSYFYFLFLLRGTGPWLVYNGLLWVKTNNLSTVVSVIYNRVVDDKINIFNTGQTTRQVGKPLLYLINVLIERRLLKYRCFWTTGTRYGLSNIIQKITGDINNIVVYTRPADSKSIWRSMKSLINLYNPLIRTQSVGISPVRSPVGNYKNMLQKHFYHLSNSRIYPAIDKIINFIDTNIVYVESIQQNILESMKNIKPQNLICHHIRWGEATVIADCAKQLNIKTILISHGTHADPSNTTANYELDMLARGLLWSEIADYSVAQSPTAEKALLGKEKRILKYQPIMWGGKAPNLSKGNKIFKILHAGTYKPMCIRPWIYETSNEFIKGLKDLILAVGELNNVELDIRIRSNDECDVASMMEILPLPKNCKVKVSGDFRNDLMKADLLISYSSTTIEEALYAKKPVALFGGSERYRHLLGTTTLPSEKNRSAVYYLTTSNITEMLKAIIISHSNKTLTNKELDEYIWTKKTPGIDVFLSNLLTE